MAVPRSAHTHPLCRQEDHWDEGDMHFQFWPCDGSDGTYCSGQQGMLIHAINGNTMQPNQWGHSQVEYTNQTHKIKTDLFTGDRR